MNEINLNTGMKTYAEYVEEQTLNQINEKANRVGIRRLEKSEEENRAKKAKLSTTQVTERSVSQLSYPLISPFPLNEETEKYHPLAYVTIYADKPNGDKVEFHILKNVLMIYSKLYEELFQEKKWKESYTNTVLWERLNLSNESYHEDAIKYVIDFMQFRAKLLKGQSYHPLKELNNVLNIFNDIYEIATTKKIDKLKKECRAFITDYSQKGLQELADSFYMTFDYSFDSGLEQIWLNSYIKAIKSPNADAFYHLILRLAKEDFSKINPAQVLIIHSYLIKAIIEICSMPSELLNQDPQLVREIYCTLFDLTYLNPHHELSLSIFISEINSSYVISYLNNLLNVNKLEKHESNCKLQLLYIYLSIRYFSVNTNIINQIQSIDERAHLIIDKNLKSIAFGLIYKNLYPKKAYHSLNSINFQKEENKKIQFDFDCLLLNFEITKTVYDQETMCKKLIDLTINYPYSAHSLWKLKALTHSQGKNYQLAIEAFSKAFNEFFNITTDLECVYQRAHCYFKLKNYSSALEDCNLYLESYQSKEYKNDWMHSSILILQINCYIEVEKFNLALDLCSEALIQQLDMTAQAKICRAQGLIHQNLKNYDLAIKNYETALAIHGGNKKNLLSMGQCYQHSSNPKLAKNCYQQVLKLDPKNPIAIFELGLYFMNESLFFYALEMFDQLKDVRLDSELTFYRCQCNLYLNNATESFNLFNKLVNFDKINFNYLLAITKLSKDLKKYDLAVKLCDEILKIATHDSIKNPTLEFRKGCLERIINR